MKLLPHDRWTIESPLDVQTLVAGMRSHIEPARWYRNPRDHDHTPLEGRIHERGFTASRVIPYRNSFLPVLRGRFIPHGNGTTVRIRMTLHRGVLLFILLWFGFFGRLLLIDLDASNPRGAWGPALMITFGVLLTYVCFFIEAGRTKDLISDVFVEVHREAVEVPC